MSIRPFQTRYREALADARLRLNLLNFQRAWRASRDAAFDRLSREAPALGAATATFEAARSRIVDAKDVVLADPAAVRDAFVARATAAGMVVHPTATGGAAPRPTTS